MTDNSEKTSAQTTHLALETIPWVGYPLLTWVILTYLVRWTSVPVIHFSDALYKVIPDKSNTVNDWARSAMFPIHDLGLVPYRPIW